MIPKKRGKWLILIFKTINRKKKNLKNEETTKVQKKLKY